ncbi:TolC family protein [Foetidibacter luteolus]|uniref:TolC family protein n=1 Tax=Foetidibacter luteolus TaxID=2608880 RepID=UPI00129A2273|nr:TolC family protein [Foetidibacter luteolus]
MKHFFQLLALVSISAGVAAQPAMLTIDDCYAKAKQYYPLVKQYGLIQKTKEFSVENAAKGYLPQLGINGQATYQSDVTQVPIKLPDVNIPVLAKDQYKIYAEATQTLYDGGNIKYQQQAKETTAAIDEQNLEVNLYALKERINQLFFGALLIDERLKQNSLQQKDVENGIGKVQALVNNGTAFRSNVDELKAELLNVEQNRTELLATRKAYLAMLGRFINEPLEETTALQQPQALLTSDSITRPELSLFDYQKRSFDIQDKMIAAGLRPKLQLFAQGGYGRPGLNMLDNGFSTYYIGGLRLNWSLAGLYTKKNDRRLTEIGRKNLDIQKEVFLFNTKLTLTQQNADIVKYQQLLAKDNEIVALRTSVKNAAHAQLENGVITPHDFITQLNAEDQAKQNMILHQVQLLQAQYNHKTTSGN